MAVASEVAETEVVEVVAEEEDVDLVDAAGSVTRDLPMKLSRFRHFFMHARGML